MKCKHCGLDKPYTYIVKYPDYKGYICHDCNIKISPEQVDKILETYHPARMSHMLRQRCSK